MAINTKELIASGLLELCETSSLKSITVGQILNHTGAGRQTFYNHFQDKYELLEWIIRTEVLDPVIPLMRSGNLKDSMVQIFHNMHQNKKFYKKVTRLEGQNSCESIAKKFIMEILFSFINEKVGEKKLAKRGLTVSMVAEYYAQSMAFVVIQWTKLDMSLTPEQVADIFEYITTHSMDEVIAEMN